MHSYLLGLVDVTIVAHVATLHPARSRHDWLGVRERGRTKVVHEVLVGAVEGTKVAEGRGPAPTVGQGLRRRPRSLVPATAMTRREEGAV